MFLGIKLQIHLMIRQAHMTSDHSSYDTILRVLIFEARVPSIRSKMKEIFAVNPMHNHIPHTRYPQARQRTA